MSPSSVVSFGDGQQIPNFGWRPSCGGWNAESDFLFVSACLLFGNR